MAQKSLHQALIVAHRGASGVAPENTVVGFEKALEYDIAQIETDCRLTSDGVVVLLHDEIMRDPAGNELSVKDSTYQTLQEHKPDIITFDEAIALIDRRVRIMVEIKSGVPVEPVLAIIRAYLAKGWQPADFIFASFDFDILKQVYTRMPQVERIVLETWSSVRAVRRAKQLNTTYLSMDQGFLWWYFVKAISRRYKLFSYPCVRPPLRLNHHRPSRWVKYGLYGIITDHPDLYARKLR